MKCTILFKKTLQLTSGSIGNSSTSISSSCTVDKTQIFHFNHSFLSVNFTIQYMSVSLPVTAKFWFRADSTCRVEHKKKHHSYNNIIVTKGANIITLESTQQEHEEHTGEYLPKIVVVWTKCSKFCTKMTKGYCFPMLLD